LAHSLQFLMSVLEQKARTDSPTADLDTMET